MSFLQGVVDAYKKGSQTDGAEWEKFREVYPAVYDFLQGMKNEAGQWEMGPAGFSFWVEGGLWHCCIRPNYFPKVAFTTLQDIQDPFAGLEAQIQKGHFEWKMSKTKR